MTLARCAALTATLMLGCVDVPAQTPPPSAQLATVRARSVPNQFLGYGEVQPIAPLPVSAIAAGIVADLKVVPGSQIKAGEVLATLAGPEIQSLLVNREAMVRSAQGELAAAARNLTIERRQLSAHLSTQQAVAAAHSTATAAQAALDTAQAQLRAAQDMRTLRAPSTGTVLAVDAAEGQRVTAGQTILTLQTANRLWLTAVYYGADALAIRVGMTGQFQPASGGAAVLVKVAAVSAALAPDAGESVGLVAMGAAHWLNGERGTVTINGAVQSLVAVPTRALILDQARWWVLVRTAKGIQAQPVVPGSARGWDTFIKQGLSPGQQVVVQNAYLDYHRGIAQRYIPPD
ncbi:MAG TPA: efflux RND transporter periplasmic adaptor subunit [Steroidobacteraceae bacterium]|nr:efflux RND transporter periplasmic adaptor subunit [Steroidobacteraceae bacterium]